MGHLIYHMFGGGERKGLSVPWAWRQGRRIFLWRERSKGSRRMAPSHPKTISQVCLWGGREVGGVQDLMDRAYLQRHSYVVLGRLLGPLSLLPRDRLRSSEESGGVCGSPKRPQSNM